MIISFTKFLRNLKLLLKIKFVLYQVFKVELSLTL